MANPIILLLCVCVKSFEVGLEGFSTYTINLFGEGKLVYHGRTKKINQENINWKNKEVYINKTKHK